MKVTHEAYAKMFGPPTVGDKVRLADTDLWIEIEKDYTSYGDEGGVFGGGKSLRVSMGGKMVKTHAMKVSWIPLLPM